MGAEEGGDERLAGCDVAWLGNACMDAKSEALFGALTDINGGDVGVWGTWSSVIAGCKLSLGDVKGAGDDGERGPVRSGAEGVRSDIGSF